MLNRKLSKKIGNVKTSKIDFEKFRYKTKEELVEEDIRNNILDKVKVIRDSYFRNNSRGSHYVVPTAFRVDSANPDRDDTDVLINALTSLTDSDGNINLNKIRKVNNGLLIEIPLDKTTSRRRSAIKLEANDYHLTNNRKIKVRDLIEPNFNYQIDKEWLKEFKDMIVDDSDRNPIKRANKNKFRNYKK